MGWCFGGTKPDRFSDDGSNGGYPSTSETSTHHTGMLAAKAHAALPEDVALVADAAAAARTGASIPEGLSSDSQHRGHVKLVLGPTSEGDDTSAATPLAQQQVVQQLQAQVASLMAKIEGLQQQQQQPQQQSAAGAMVTHAGGPAGKQSGLDEGQISDIEARLQRLEALAEGGGLPEMVCAAAGEGCSGGLGAGPPSGELVQRITEVEEAIVRVAAAEEELTQLKALCTGTEPTGLVPRAEVTGRLDGLLARLQKVEDAQMLNSSTNLLLPPAKAEVHDDNEPHASELEPEQHSPNKQQQVKDQAFYQIKAKSIAAEVLEQVLQEVGPGLESALEDSEKALRLASCASGDVENLRAASKKSNKKVEELSQGLVTVTKTLHDRLVKLDAMQRKLAARMEAKMVSMHTDRPTADDLALPSPTPSVDNLLRMWSSNKGGGPLNNDRLGPMSNSAAWPAAERASPPRTSGGGDALQQPTQASSSNAQKLAGPMLLGSSRQFTSSRYTSAASLRQSQAEQKLEKRREELAQMATQSKSSGKQRPSMDGKELYIPEVLDSFGDSTVLQAQSPALKSGLRTSNNGALARTSNNGAGIAAPATTNSSSKGALRATNTGTLPRSSDSKPAGGAAKKVQLEELMVKQSAFVRNVETGKTPAAASTGGLASGLNTVGSKRSTAGVFRPMNRDNRASEDGAARFRKL